LEDGRLVEHEQQINGFMNPKQSPKILTDMTPNLYNMRNPENSHYSYSSKII
jgi:hypothetical protein